MKPNPLTAADQMVNNLHGWVSYIFKSDSDGESEPDHTSLHH